jgi:hypothetical protein
MKIYKIFGILSGILLYSILMIPSVYASDAYILGMVYDGKVLKLESDTLLTKAVSFTENSKLIFDEEVNDKKKGNYYIKFWIGDVYMPQVLYFTPKKGNFKLEIPALAHIQRLDVYQPDNVSLFSVDVRGFAKCNTDGMCQYELGENQYNCIADCAVDNPVYSDETNELFSKSGDVIKDSQGESVLYRLENGQPVAQASSEVEQAEKTLAWDKIAFLIAFILALSGGVLVLIFKKKGLIR